MSYNLSTTQYQRQHNRESVRRANDFEENRSPQSLSLCELRTDDPIQERSLVLWGGKLPTGPQPTTTSTLPSPPESGILILAQIA